MSPATKASRSDVESWFVGHGLPWFIDREDARIAQLLTFGRLWPIITGITVIALVVGGLGFGAALGATDANAGAAAGTALVTALWTAGVLATGYALTALRGWGIARWAARRALGDLGLLVPLVTRALPLLLLFTTFLFINTEVWQVASALSRPVLWLAVAFFGVLAVAFLLARLPEEVAEVNDVLDADVVRRAVRGTPLEPHLD